MIFKAPPSDGRVHEAEIEGHKVSLFRSNAGDDHLVLNAIDQNRSTRHVVSITNGVADLATANSSSFTYETFVSEENGIKTLHWRQLERPEQAVLGIYAILSQFPEILPDTKEIPTPSAEFLRMIWADEQLAN